MSWIVPGLALRTAMPPSKSTMAAFATVEPGVKFNCVVGPDRGGGPLGGQCR